MEILNNLQLKLKSIADKLTSIKEQAEEEYTRKTKMQERWKKNEDLPIGIVDENGVFRVGRSN